MQITSISIQTFLRRSWITLSENSFPIGVQIYRTQAGSTHSETTETVVSCVLPLDLCAASGRILVRHSGEQIKL